MKTPIYSGAAAALLLSLGVAAQGLPTEPSQVDPAEPMDDTVPSTGEVLPGQLPAGAAGVGLSTDSDLRKLDANADGSVSEQEVQGDARLRQRFDALDEDGDGRLSKQELSARAPAKR